MTRLRRWGRRLGIALAILVGVIGAALLGLGTPPGRALILRVAMRALAPVFSGELRAAHLEGSPLRGKVVVLDATLTDADGRPTIHADRVEAEIDLLALVRGKVLVTHLHVLGADVLMQPLADGTLNLARLVRLGPSKPDDPPSKIIVSLDAEEVRGRYRWTSPNGTYLAVDVATRARLLVDPGRVRIETDGLRGEVATPVVGSVSGRSTLVIEGGQLRFSQTGLDVTTDGPALAALSGLPLAGRFTARVDVDGPLDDLHVETTITPPRGELHASTHVHARRDGAVMVDHATASIDGIGLELAGTLDFSGAGQGTIGVHAADLATLAQLGLVGVRGSLDLDATFTRSEGALRGDGSARVRGLRAGTIAIDRLDLDAHTVNLVGKIGARGAGLTISGVRIASFSAAFDGTLARLRLTASAAQPGGARAEISLVAVPTWGPRGPRELPMSIEGRIETLRVLAAGQLASLREPAPLRLQRLPTLAASFSPLRLRVVGADGAAEVRYDNRGLVTKLTVEHLDAAPLWPLLPLRAASPLASTDVAVMLSAEGPLDQLRLQGTIEGSALLVADPSPVALRVDARREGGALRGHAELGWRAQHLEGDLDLPRVSTSPISIHATAKLDLQQALAVKALAALLPPLPRSIQPIDGAVTLDATIAGTRQRPTLGLRVDAPALHLGLLEAVTTLTASYQEGEARIELAGKLANGATINASAQAPIPWPLPTSLSLPALDGKLTLSGIDLARLSWSSLGMQAQAQSGSVAADLTLSMQASKWTAVGSLTGLRIVTAWAPAVDVRMNARFVDERLTIDGTIGAPELPQLRVHGELLPRTPLRTSELTAELSIAKLELATLSLVAPGLTGVANGSVRIEGPLGTPRIGGKLHAAPLHYGPLALDALDLDGTLDREQLKLAVTGLAGARQVVALDGKAALAADGALSARLTIDRLALAQAEHGRTRKLTGRLGGSLSVDGTRDRPRVRGAVSLAEGELIHDALPLPVRAIHGKIASNDGDHLTLDLAGKIGEGEARVDGSLHLADDGAHSMRLHATLREVMWRVRGVNLWLTSELRSEIDRADDRWLVDVAIAGGTARFSELSNARALHSTGPLADVTIVGAVRAERSRWANASVKLHLDRPLLLRSAELSLDLDGALRIELEPARTRIVGRVSNRVGWITLLGRRYEIERGFLGFLEGATVATDVDVRLSRSVQGGLIGVDAHGEVSSPRISFWSVPARYDASQVMAMVLSGSTGETSSELDRQNTAGASGMVSTLLMRSIKETFAPGLPIDVVRIEAGQRASDGTATTRFEVGKYLTPSLYLGYSYQGGADRIGTRRVNHNSGRVVYHIIPQLELEASFGDAGVGNLDLFWSKRY